MFQSIDLDIIYQDKLNIRVSTSYDTGFPLGDIGASADISLIAFHTSVRFQNQFRQGFVVH